MIRASAKNNAAVTILTSPSQYSKFTQELSDNNGCTTFSFRKNMAAAAYALTSAYDSAVSGWLAGEAACQPQMLRDNLVTLRQDRTYDIHGLLPCRKEPLNCSLLASQVTEPPAKKTVAFEPLGPALEMPLKYGCNPHQLPAGLCAVAGKKLPFEARCPRPGYINLLDAINAWQLVHELAQATGLPADSSDMILRSRKAAASFKHVSPAGAAIGIPLSDEDVPATRWSQAAAYVRARNADPMCSFGDFVAISHEVDMVKAQEDWRIELLLALSFPSTPKAPSFVPEALEVLKAKKGGKFIVLKADFGVCFVASEVGGVGFMQKRNDALFDASKLSEVVTSQKTLPDKAQKDLILASIAIKYTQSNSVGYSKDWGGHILKASHVNAESWYVFSLTWTTVVQDGMMIGVGAGQQSRVDCVKLAGRKVATWWLRPVEGHATIPFVLLI
eukprot:Skav219417  [mRNA]  locus=scaffold4055:6352:10302:- [translate_table: standard]